MTGRTALLGVIGVVYWVTTLVVLTLVNRSSYDSLRQPGSELALGRFGWAMDVAFFVLGIGLAGLGLAFDKALGRVRALPWLLAVVGLLLFLSGLVHTEMGSGTRPSIHNMLGLGAFVLTIMVMFGASRAFRKEARWHRMAIPTLVWAFAALGTFFLVPIMGESLLGLAQRIFVATTFSWYLLVATLIYRSSREGSSVDGALRETGG